MKAFFAFVYLVIFSAASLAQTAPHSSDPELQALVAKSRAVLEAIKAKDSVALNGLLAPNFRSIDVGGSFSSREETLGAAHEGFLKDFLFYNPQVIAIDNDSALVTYDNAITLSDQAVQDMVDDNVAWPRYSKVSDLWVRQGGDWKLRFEQVTPLRAMY